MKQFVIVLLAVTLLLSRRAAESAGSCDNELIDGDKYRVSDQLFFTDRNTSEPAYKVREGSGDSWCTEVGLSVHDSPWIEVRFGVDVEIRALSTAGLSRIFFQEYVRSYQVQYARLGQQQLQYVTNQGSTSIKTFGRQNNPDLQRVELPAPIVAERLRIIVVPGSWTTSYRERACMRVEAHGCPVHTTCSSSFRLSNDSTLLPLASIVASSQTNDDPASDLVSTGNLEWCTNETIQSGPHIMLNFTKPVVLTHMIGRGDQSYVTGFSIQSLIGGSFEEYQQPNGTIEFIARDEDPTVFTFWRPLHANNSIRFNVLEARYDNSLFSNNEFCFNVQLFGCPLSQANVSSSSTKPSTSVIPSQVTPTTYYSQSPSSMTLTSFPSSMMTSSSLISSHLLMDLSATSSSVPMASMSSSVPMLSPPSVNSLSGQAVGVSVGVVLAVLMGILLIMAIIVTWRLRSRKRKTLIEFVLPDAGQDDGHSEIEMKNNIGYGKLPGINSSKPAEMVRQIYEEFPYPYEEPIPTIHKSREETDYEYVNNRQGQGEAYKPAIYEAVMRDDDGYYANDDLFPPADKYKETGGNTAAAQETEKVRKAINSSGVNDPTKQEHHYY